VSSVALRLALHPVLLESVLYRTAYHFPWHPPSLSKLFGFYICAQKHDLDIIYFAIWQFAPIFHNPAKYR